MVTPLDVVDAGVYEQLATQIEINNEELKDALIFIGKTQTSYRKQDDDFKKGMRYVRKKSGTLVSIRQIKFLVKSNKNKYKISFFADRIIEATKKESCSNSCPDKNNKPFCARCLFLVTFFMLVTLRFILLLALRFCEKIKKQITPFHSAIVPVRELSFSVKEFKEHSVNYIFICYGLINTLPDINDRWLINLHLIEIISFLRKVTINYNLLISNKNTILEKGYASDEELIFFYDSISGILQLISSQGFLNDYFKRNVENIQNMLLIP